MSTATLTDFDIHLLAEGKHYRSYEKLGAHFANRDGVDGVQFAVWAPNAEYVSVIGDFNGWNPDANPMEVRHGAGVWDAFMPGIQTRRAVQIPHPIPLQRL